MAEIKVKCFAINPALTPDGQRMFGIHLGVALDAPKSQVNTGSMALWDPRAVFFVSEQDWNQMKDRPNVGDDFTIRIEGASMTVKRK